MIAGPIDANDHSEATIAYGGVSISLILENSLEAAVLTDQNDIILDWNAGATKLFGWTRAQVKGKKISELLRSPEANDRLKFHALDQKGNSLHIERTVIPLPLTGQILNLSFLFDRSDAKKAQEDLSASEERFRTLFEQSPFSIQLLAPDGRTLKVNKSWQQLLNLPDEVIEHFILKDYNIFADAQLDAKGITPYIRRAFDGEITKTPPVLYDPSEMGKPGRPRWMEAFSYPVKSNNGKVQEVVLIHEDITEQFLAKKAILESEERFRLLVEGVQDYSIFMLDSQGSVISWNAGAQRTNGYRSEEILGRDFSVFYTQSAQDEEQPQRDLLRATTAGSFEDEGYRVRSDGTTFWASILITALRNDIGELRGFSSIIRDVTFKKVADEEKQILISVIESSADFVCVSGLDGRIIYINQAGRKMVGLDPTQEVKGSFVTDFFTSEEYHRIGKDVSPQALFNGGWEGEVQIYNRRTNNTTPGLMNSFVIKDKDQKAIAFANIGRNIKELKDVQQRLEEAVGARDEFISICSHELNTPITSLKLQFQMAERQIAKNDLTVYSKENVDKQVELVNRQLNRMGKLIKEMLDVSRIARGKLQMEITEFDLTATIQQVIDRFRNQFKSQDMQLELQVPDQAIKIYGDQFRIEQIIANLLTNALKYGAKNSVEVTFDADHNWATLKVADQGVGIDKRHFKKIFEQYERAIPSNNISGLGLGLYICKQITEAHHGKIDVESELGKGSVFTVQLPLLKKVTELLVDQVTK